MKSFSCPALHGFLFPKRHILPRFCCVQEPSSRLMAVMLHVSVSNRRKAMSGKAAKIRLTEKQHAILQQIVRSTTAPQRLVQRTRLIVLAFDGMFNRMIANEIGLHRKQVFVEATLEAILRRAGGHRVPRVAGCTSSRHRRGFGRRPTERSRRGCGLGICGGQPEYAL